MLLAMKRACLILLLLVSTAGRADTPPPEYFAGRYMMIGRDGGVQRGLVDDQARLDLEGPALRVTTCGQGAGVLRQDTGFEGGFFLSGDLAGEPVDCQYFNSYDNYPLLACWTETGSRLTLWPMGDGRPDMPLDCRPR